MAGDWIKMRTNLDTDPAVVRISSGLNTDRYSVVGRLHRIWSWANEHLTDGQDVPIDSEFLDCLVETPGFAEQLRRVGWLTGRDGSLGFPSFERHNGASAKSRAMDSERKRGVRKLSGSQPDKTRTREEKRREEKSIPPLIPQGDPELCGVIVPRELNTERFKTVLKSWLMIIVSMQGKVNPVAVEADLSKLSSYTERKAVGFVTAWVAGSRFTANWKADWEAYQPSECESPKNEELENYGPRVKPQMKKEAIANG